jgi:DNA mismatch endonuclease, patch repair protein
MESMADVHTPEQRSFNMSRIRGRDTKPELALRRGLHALGFRYCLHRRDLPGSPDLAFPARRKVVFVHGCFWHGHNCPMGRLPSSRVGFWHTKIETNKHRDRRATDALAAAGWQVIVVWECAIRGPGRLAKQGVLTRCAELLQNHGRTRAEVTGEWTTAQGGVDAG